MRKRGFIKIENFPPLGGTKGGKMPNKKKFVLRVDERTMAAVEKWAADEFRSVNGQLEWIITKALKEAKRYKPPRDKISDED